MAREKEYTPEKLEREVKKYFRSITRIVTMTEKVRVQIGEDEEGFPIYKTDEMGHVVLADKPIINDLGKEMRVIQYILPPSVGALCIYLKIHRSTWDRYCDMEEFCDTTTHARGLMHAYLEQESLTRKGKDLKGILFNLENNYGYTNRVQVESETFEQWLNNQGSGGGPAF